MHKEPLFGAPRAITRRHRVLVALLGVVGLCGGIVTGIVLSAPSPSATAVVLPPSPPSAGGSSAPLTVREAVDAVTSQPVLAAASRSAWPPVSASELARRVKVVAHGEALFIQVKAASNGAARQLTNVVAHSYVNYSRGPGSGAVILQAATEAPPRSLVSPIDGIGGLIAGLAMGSVILWKDRREWRDVQLIHT